MELEKLTDKELVSIANKNGSFNQVYAILYGRHKKNVDNFLYKYIKNNEEREDASQDALIKVFLHLDKYTPSDFEFKSWVFRIAENTAIDHARKNKVKGKYLIDKSKEIDKLETSLKGKNYGPDETLIHKEMFSRIESAIDTLPEKYHGLLKKFFFEKYKYLELAEEFDIPLSNVRSRISRGRKSLQKILFPKDTSNIYK